MDLALQCDQVNDIMLGQAQTIFQLWSAVHRSVHTVCTTAGSKQYAVCVFTAATNLCFGEKNVYTSEVLAVVMQQLMEHSPLPMLLMRTVIQSLTMYPRLGGFVMNILSRLIVKQVSTKLQTEFFFNDISTNWSNR